MPSVFELVDLTLDSSSSAAEEVIVNFNVPGPGDPGSGDGGRALSISGSEPSFKNGPSLSRSQSPLTHQSPSRGAAFQPTAPSPPPEVSPAKSARFSSKDEVIQQHPRPSSSRGSSRHFTPQAAQPSSRAREASLAQTPKKSNWTVDKIAYALRTYSAAVEQGHSRLVEYMLDVTEQAAPQPRNLSSSDPFASMESCAVELPVEESARIMTIRFKQHSGEYGKQKGGHGRKGVGFPVSPIKSDQEPVPKYRFHHVEVRKNILTPNTMLNFVPHLRDVDPNSAEEKKYSNWLSELEKLDTQSGFKTSDRADKVARRQCEEYARTLALYLDRWLKRLNIEGCTMSTLISFMASHSKTDDAITPQQKSDLLDRYSESTISPQAAKAAKMFTEAFDRVFNDKATTTRPVSLRDILMLDKSVETIVDNKRAKDTPSSQKFQQKELLPKIEEQVLSYTALGCLICFSHDCEHGDLNAENQRGAFCLDTIGGLGLSLKEKWMSQVEARKKQNGAVNTQVHPACKNHCHRNYDGSNDTQPTEPWTDSNIAVLEQIFASLGYSTLGPSCFVAAVLGRKCWEVYRKLKELDLKLPEIKVPDEKPKVKPVPWYDRKKKLLLGDWQDQINTHEHAIRDIVEPCHHQGPCTKDGKGDRRCPCAESGLLCERFCHCTADDCAIKFTGCACRGAGKTCLQRQKEMKPCICILLNRECDPVLCGGCGALERADPENAHDERLHLTGCQNVSLQRGAAKTVLLGKSKVPECGYGLFTAEEIFEGEFVIEYTGELISHDEGVRREARRGDVFDEEKNSSYLFTLLENEGIWVDAAIYGNLSRYINHAPETDRRACNITPKILYVNGEFRIKFTAIRDIKAGEELFFNYGDYFPNLTKKLLEENDETQGNDFYPKPKATVKPGTTARKAAKKSRNGIDSDEEMEWLARITRGDDDDEMAGEYEDHTPRKIKKKRGGRRPGAGRKKKIPVDPANPAAGGTAPLNTNTNKSPEISDSQGESSQFTPSRRRAPNRKMSNQTGSPDDASLLRAQLMQNSPTGNGSFPAPSNPFGLPQVKKVSKRGGARPGAGRKPKKPAIPKVDSNAASSSSAPKDNNINKTTVSGNGGGGGGASTKAASEAGKTTAASTTAPEDSEDLPMRSTAATAAPAPAKIKITKIKINIPTSNANSNSRGNAHGGSLGSGPTSRANNPNPSPSCSTTTAGRKRARASVDSDGDVEMMSRSGNSSSLSPPPAVLKRPSPPMTLERTSPRGGTGDLSLRQDHFQHISDAALDDDEEDDDSVRSADRSARKRQKPLRYRESE